MAICFRIVVFEFVGVRETVERLRRDKCVIAGCSDKTAVCFARQWAPLSPFAMCRAVSADTRVLIPSCGMYLVVQRFDFLRFRVVGTSRARPQALFY